MKCKEAYVCLLTSQSPANVPEELQRHLQRCTSCRQRQQRLLALEEEMRQQPPPVESTAARLRLFEQLAPRTPAALTPMPPVVNPAETRPLTRHGSPIARRQRWAITAVAVAAILVFALGLSLGWSLSQRDGVLIAGRSTGKGPATGPREAIVDQILENNLRLAEVSTSPERLTLLANMAGELRGEALRLAREGGTSEDVLLLSGLYERVVCQGMVGQAMALASKEQAGLVASLVKQLEETATESDRAAQAAQPGAGEGLRTLAAASRAASRSMSSESPVPPELRSPPWQPARSGTVRDLLGTLVLEGMRLATEDDPLRRADSCNDVADHLVQGILLASSGGDTDRAARLGSYLGNVRDRGINKNLERFEPVNAQDKRAEEADRIGLRADQAVEVLEQQLAKAPPAAQPGLRKALEAQEKFKNNSKGKGKGKGKPQGKQ
jgi:hypothetical protein